MAPCSLDYAISEIYIIEKVDSWDQIIENCCISFDNEISRSKKLVAPFSLANSIINSAHGLSSSSWARKWGVISHHAQADLQNVNHVHDCCKSYSFLRFDGVVVVSAE